MTAYTEKQYVEEMIATRRKIHQTPEEVIFLVWHGFTMGGSVIVRIAFIVIEMCIRDSFYYLRVHSAIINKKVYLIWEEFQDFIRKDD